MRPIKTALNAISGLILIGLVAVLLLYGAVETGVIDTSSDPEPVVEGPENTSHIPEVNASDHPDIDGETLEREIHDRINEKRVANGREPLVWSEQVRLIARLHSHDMAQRDYFNHTNPDGENQIERHDQYDGCDRPNENIAKSYDLSGNISKMSGIIVDEWNRSVAHRNNFLNTVYHITGIGVHATEDGRVYVTQNFCREHPSA